MTPPRIQTDRPSFAFLSLAAFLVLVFLTGGASRVDVQSLAVLRPLSIVACTLALLTVSRSEIMALRGLFVAFAVIFAVVAIQLVPLPPALWTNLPGRADIAAVDQAAGLGAVWRPLTLTPMNGWHTLLSLFAPLAVLLFGAQLRAKDMQRLLPLVIVLGLVSGLFGLIQVIGRPDGPFYLYRVTNITSAVGLFANRNHAALLLALLLPMMATWVMLGARRGSGEQAAVQLRATIAVALGVFLFPLVIVTGSRSGFLLALFGMAVAATIYLRQYGLPRSLSGSLRGKLAMLSGTLAGGATLAVLTFYLAKGEAIQRLLGVSLEEDTRVESWKGSMELLWRYFPAGSGAGSFAEVYQLYEPDRLIDRYYLNHVHNDFIEIVLTFGLPGLILLGVGIALYCARVLSLWRDPPADTGKAKLARLAAVAILMIGAASVVDYPLRTPTFLCLLALLSLWFYGAGLPGEPRTSTRSKRAPK